ncbi:hypothetical protein N7454_002084 [Penicillium verhagenii]|nr:hypothetical protein N7454_002084 [Penicillium verhagenii]
MTVKNYDAEDEITDFFKKTTVTRSECDEYAKKHAGSNVTPVPVQGVCSYTVYAGPRLEFVVQFRLKSLLLKMETMKLANAIYGKLTPQVNFKGEMGEASEDKEPLFIYIMDRLPGVSPLDFLRAHNLGANEPEFFGYRKTLMLDIARFFIACWKAPQDVPQVYRTRLRNQYEKDLKLLLTCLPDRFSPLIQAVLESMSEFFSLPMALLHQDFGEFNILVDETTYGLLGVIDWAEAEILPFGLNLFHHQRMISKIHITQGWSRYDDYRSLEEVFWNTFQKETEVSDKTVSIIKMARIMGVFLMVGFTPRLADQPEPVPIRDDESGAYKMRELDGLLINPATRFLDL